MLIFRPFQYFFDLFFGTDNKGGGVGVGTPLLSPPLSGAAPAIVQFRTTRLFELSAFSSSLINKQGVKSLFH